ncbi:MAG: copper amine oxidase N-terminal domain-containing protein [Candidatus Eremiobacteraeota bacterium]|nr:copper amine oxidase N-terminal domain-containing protein [Candidatus Eremiobacteraeota bacterium]
MGRAFLTVVILIAVGTATLGAPPVQVTLNENPLAAPAIMRDGRVLLPFRAIFSALHADVKYDAALHEVHAQRGGDRVFIKVGTHNSIVVADHLFVPVRYISESLGAKVSYDSTDRIVFITDTRANMKLTQVPRIVATDAPPVATATFSPPPIAYATPDPNAPPNFIQSLNFYVPSNQRTYYPGDPLHFVLDAPPSGTAYLQLCNYERVQFIHPRGTTMYFVDLRVPNRLAGHSCSATAYFIGPLGARQAVMLPFPLAFLETSTPTPRPTATPTPVPTPSPTPFVIPSRVTEPVFRMPQGVVTSKPMPPIPKATPPM